jgi:glycosyltransferase involved in cell wall biosynthesis
MRILALTPCYYPHMGGAERTLFELYSRVAQAGHQVDLITIRQEDESDTVAPGFRVYPVGHPLRSRFRKVLQHQYWHWRKARQLLREGRYDLAVLTYGVRDVLVQGYLQTGRHLPVVILEFHLGTGSEISSAAENPSYVRPLLKYAYKHADAVIAISRDNANFVREMSGRDDSIVIPQGADPDYWSPAWRDTELRRRYCPDDVPLLLTVSRLSRRKNLQDMVAAAARLRSRGHDFRMVIAGTGEEQALLERQIASTNLGMHVSLAGFLDDRTVQQLYASADVYLSTSTYEGFGLSIVQAMAAGLPIVAYRAKGTDDYFIDGEIGYLTQHSVDEFSTRCADLLAAPEKRRRMGAHARELVLRQFNWDRYTTEHLAVFEAVVRKNRKGN